MELDKRIKSLSDIMTCFDIEKARQFIGQNGYFSNYISDFKCTESCKYGTLEDVFDDEDTFQLKSSVYYYFIPESSLKSKEKKYRPYKNTEEFFKKTNHKVGSLISIKDKMSNVEKHLMIVGYSDNFLYLGSLYYPLSELFDKFEIYDWTGKKDEWIPFGVAE